MKITKDVTDEIEILDEILEMLETSNGYVMGEIDLAKAALNDIEKLQILKHDEAIELLDTLRGAILRD